MKAPVEVRRALDHVRARYPGITHVFYSREGKWYFCSDEFKGPAFGASIDIGLLEDAADAVSNTCGFPAAFFVEE